MKATTLTVIAAVGAMSALFAVEATALPLAPARTAADNNIMLVRDGCGPGMRYSVHRDACVRRHDWAPRAYERRRHRNDAFRTLNRFFNAVPHHQRRDHWRDRHHRFDR